MDQPSQPGLYERASMWIRDLSEHLPGSDGVNTVLQLALFLAVGFGVLFIIATFAVGLDTTFPWLHHVLRGCAEPQCHSDGVSYR